jgi:hypothetical protein
VLITVYDAKFRVVAAESSRRNSLENQECLPNSPYAPFSERKLTCNVWKNLNKHYLHGSVCFISVHDSILKLIDKPLLASGIIVTKIIPSHPTSCCVCYRVLDAPIWLGSVSLGIAFG